MNPKTSSVLGDAMRNAMTAIGIVAKDAAQNATQGREPVQNDPVYNDTGAYGGYGYGGGGGSSAPAYNPGDMAYLNDQDAKLASQLNRTNTTLNQGISRIGQTYNKEVDSANTKQSRFLQDLGTTRTDTMRGKDSAIGKVDTNARTLANSLRLRLGMAGGGDSSAYNLAAPNAVAREATQDRTNVLESFGKNFRDLDVREKRGIDDFASLLRDLAEQKRTREQDFRAGVTDQQNEITRNRAEIARQKALLQGGGYDQVKAAMSPFEAEISQRESAIDKLLGNITPYKVRAIDTKMPNLRDYMVDRAAINANRATGAQDQYAPYRQNLVDEEENITLV